MNQDFIDKKEPKWYIIRIQSGKENFIIEKIKSASKILEKSGLNFNDFFYEFSVPKIQVFEYKDGVKIEKFITAYPGYIFIKMILIDELNLFIKKVIGTMIKIDYISDNDYESMLSAISSRSKESSVVFSIGQKVKINSGSFASMEGVIDDINEPNMKLSVIIPIFGYDTKVDVNFDNVALITE